MGEAGALGGWHSLSAARMAAELLERLQKLPRHRAVEELKRSEEGLVFKCMQSLWTLLPVR